MMKRPKPSPGNFQLPPEISSHKEYGPTGWIYTFRHQELGELGRIFLQGHPGGRCQVTSEIAGDPDDPMTKRRTEIFGPLSVEIMRQMDLALGGTGDIGKSAPFPNDRPPAKGKGFHSKHIQCEKCGEFVAILIFADEAKDASGLEDCARMMFPKIREWNLPTWIIGPPMGDALSLDPPARILKVWQGQSHEMCHRMNQCM
jgi:hypothetical protein